MIPVFLLHALISNEAAMAAPLPVPLFLKVGFSSVLEFDSKPSRVVIGDGGSFQVERLENSLVVRPTADEATTNLLVYFPNQPTRMFVLRSTMEEEPALYRKYGLDKPPPLAGKGFVRSEVRLSRITSAKFDAKKDFLTIEALIAAPVSGKIQPDWNAVRLKKSAKEIAPKKLWAERTEVQAGTALKARFVFERPDVGSLRGTTIILPLKGVKMPITLNLGASK